MKKTALIIIATICMSSCGNNTNKQNYYTENDAETETETETEIPMQNISESASDSAQMENSYALVNVSIDMPYGDSPADGKTRKGLKDLAYEYLSHIGAETKNPLFARAQNESSTDAIADTYCRYVYSNLQKKSKKDYDEALNGGWATDKPIQYTIEYRLKKLSETTNYAVYEESTYVYLGGAHGSYTAKYYTFDKSDGYIFNDFLKSGCLYDLQDIIKNGIISYLGECGIDTENEKVLADNLLIEGDVIPLPSSPLCPTKNGIMFVYQTYEIAPYSVGCISFTCPYQKIMPYLTDKAKNLIK